MTGRVIRLRPRTADATAVQPVGGIAPTTVLLLVPVATLLVVGVGAIMTSSSVLAFQETGDRLFFFKRQVAWSLLGVAGLGVATRIPYAWYRKMAVPLLLIGVASLVAVLAVGELRGGARRWIAFGPATVQPSEFVKFAVIAYLAAVYARRQECLDDFRQVFAPLAAAVGGCGVLILAQPDLGTTLLVAAGAFAVVVVSGAPLRFLAGLAAGGGALAVTLAATSSYRWARVTSFLDPFADPLGTGMQAVQSLVALGTGGWFGVGLGASRARWLFLPNAHTDFVFAIIGEEMGLTGSLVIVALFAAFAVAGTVIALRAPDVFSRMLAAGIVAWLSVQALVNIGGVTAWLPITGVPLPFVSFGGTALVTNLMAVGVLVNISQSAHRGAAR